MIDGLVAHVERFLGTIEGTWSVGPDGVELPFRIAHHETGRGAKSPSGAEIYSTLGLSARKLGRRRSRIELLMIVPGQTTGGAVPPVLLHAGEMILDAYDVPQFGDIFTSVEALGEFSPMDSLYVGRPLYQPNEFTPYDDGRHRVHFQWLIPIYEIEAEYVEREGWPAFEQLMWDLDVDPTDVVREPWL